MIASSFVKLQQMLDDIKTCRIKQNKGFGFLTLYFTRPVNPLLKKAPLLVDHTNTS